jgi:uncharacterized membrane protein
MRQEREVVMFEKIADFLLAIVIIIFVVLAGVLFIFCSELFWTVILGPFPDTSMGNTLIRFYEEGLFGRGDFIAFFVGIVLLASLGVWALMQNDINYKKGGSDA